MARISLNMAGPNSTRSRMYNDLVEANKNRISDVGDGHWVGAKIDSYYMNMIADKPIYRLEINDKLGIDIDCYDLLNDWHPELGDHYNSVGDLPTWVQEKLAVLMILDPEQRNEEVTGIGRRINKRVFWVYSHGTNP